ncbi:MAG: 3-isopropylmalate dehydrogenase [Candidatus Contendobacter sp.]|nr:MAG: 3-isopropylmalate dehydrogenase [Candidatus Contendobacter sp.]
MTHKILILPGDGIGPEIVAEAVKVLECLRQEHGLDATLEYGLLGGCAVDALGAPYPEETRRQARTAAAILLGAVGGPKWEKLDRPLRAESGLLAIRADLELFANLRPALLYPQLAAASTLKPEIVAGLDILIVRELNGDVYFGQPRGIRTLDSGEREGFNTMIYRESEIERIARVAFAAARQRARRLCSVDKANALETSELWRQVVQRVAQDYPDVVLSHLYVDNAAMQLVRAPRQFDVIVTGNLFGDILSDCAAMLTGSIGMLPSASLDASGKGLYEPIHGSAPDIASQGVANPLATILSVAMLLRHTLNAPEQAERIERAVGRVLDKGLRTMDIMAPGMIPVGTQAMGDAVAAAL